MSRMHTLKSGPFDPTQRRPSNDDRIQLEPKPLDRRRSSETESLSDGFPLPPTTFKQPSNSTQSPVEPPAPVAPLNQSTNESQTTDKKVPPGRPARPDEGLSPMLLNQMRDEPASIPQSTSPPPEVSLPVIPPRSPERSRTFPRPGHVDSDSPTLPTISKMPSMPSLRKKPPPAKETQTEQQLPNSQFPFPARSQSKNTERIDYRMQDAPPVPKPVHLHREDSLHKSSGSGSSTASSAHSLGVSMTSSGPSPITSAASSVDAFSPLSTEPGPYGEEKGMRVAGLKVKNQQEPGMRAEQPKGRSASPRNFAKPSPPKEDATPVEEQPPALPTPEPFPMESPMDPELQNGKIGDGADASSLSKLDTGTPTLDDGPAVKPLKRSSSNYELHRDAFPLPPVSPLSPASPPKQPQSRPRSRTNAGPRLEPRRFGDSGGPPQPQPVRPAFLSQDPMRGQARPPIARNPPSIPQNAPRPPLERRPTVGGKAICRGCSLVIEGKSVKAADGRLTGRWHKACFVCKTCEEPFTTADFYVINNHPYCEQHYHEKNGSVCHGCHRGIEGQYLETSSVGPAGRVARKYHRRCFVCVDCRAVLSDDYFEISGRIYCERHALAAMRGPARAMGPGRPGLHPHGASGLRAERRTTKLMQMG